MSGEVKKVNAEILRVLHEVADQLTGLTSLMKSCDGRLARIEASLDRLEDPATLDAGSEIDEVVVH